MFIAYKIRSKGKLNRFKNQQEHTFDFKLN